MQNIARKGHDGTADIQVALLKFRQGDLDEAQRLCREILARSPEESPALHLSGLIAYQRQEFTAALTLLSEAIRHQPTRAAYHCDLGSVYLACLQNAQALACFERAAQLQPNLTPAYNNGGLALMAMNRLDEAQAWFERALTLDPQYTEAYYNLALALQAKREWPAARRAMESALATNPLFAKAHFGLGDICQSEGDFRQAASHFQQAIQVKPNYVKAHNRLAQCLAEDGRVDEAIFWMSLAARLAPQDAETFCNYGNMLQKKRDFQRAVPMYRRALELKPDYAEAHFNLGLVNLMLGRFEEGWPEFEWRLRHFPPDSGYPNRHGLPLWQGQTLKDKTLLVYDEQGFGDVFLYLRYLPRLVQAGGRIVLETRPALIDLFRQLPHVHELVVRGKTVRPQSQCDFCIPLASLPGRLGVRLETISDDGPYLFSDPALKAHWAGRLNPDKFKIGLVWSGSNVDPKRRLDVNLLAPLSAFEQIAIYGLQKPLDTSASSQEELSPWVHNLGPELDTFAHTAAVIANCDLIVTIDTAVAHLAGAMGRPVWVLLPYIADWRWFLDREDSPWYPSMRLFRQQRPGDWTPPICSMLVALEKLVAEKSNTPSLARAHNNDRQAADANFREVQLFEEQGALDAAMESYHRAIANDPSLMESHYNLGVLYFQLGRWPAAAARFRAAWALSPRFVPAVFNLAQTYEAAGFHPAAVEAYRLATLIDPAYTPAVYNLGLLLFRMRRYAEAANALQRSTENDPNDYRAHNNLGMALHHIGKLDEAMAAFEAAIRLKPDFAGALQNIGNVHMDRGQWDQTLSYYRRALDHNQHDPAAHHAMAKLYLENLDLANARRHFETTVALQPDNATAQFDLATLYLLQGDYTEGWKRLHWRFKRPQSHIRVYPFQHQLPAWNGRPFKDRTLLVHCEQGLGDTIQFARFIPLIKSLGGKVWFQVQSPLLPLFAEFPGVDRLLGLTDRPPDLAGVDLVIPIMSVPGCLNITEATIPRSVPYLHSHGDRAKKWRNQILPDAFKIGIVWSGNPMHVNDARRSCPIHHFHRLSRMAGIQLYSLQKNRDPSEYQHLISSGAMIHLGDQLQDFGDTAAVIAHMDLIITVDTAMAHLAGAMGRPVWILLPYLPDWRWGLNGEQSIWYPQARLFRQPQRGAWDALFEQVRTALEKEMEPRC